MRSQLSNLSSAALLARLQKQMHSKASAKTQTTEQNKERDLIISQHFPTNVSKSNSFSLIITSEHKFLNIFNNVRKYLSDPVNFINVYFILC